LSSTGIQYQLGTNNFTGTHETPTSPPSTNIVSSLGNSFSVTLPPYTMMVYTIPILNTAPVLAPIGNQAVNVGQIIAFTAGATDTDLPPQTLTFNLLNAPTNATLSASGNFFWRPDVSQAGTTNFISLEVTDNGTPSLSATQNFTVVVAALAAPSVSSAAWSEARFTLQVNGEAGPDYAVEGSTNLIDWTIQFITNAPAMPFQWMDANPATLPVQFYRIKTGPPLP
jgi:hypothetical protein